MPDPDVLRMEGTVPTYVLTHTVGDGQDFR